MKLSTMVAAAGGALFIASSVNAGFDQISWVEVDNGGVADRTIDLYVTFDSSLDEVNAVAGTVLNRLSLRVEGGTFYQNGFGGTTAPNGSLFDPFPSVAYDTFVTIGKLTSTDDMTQLSPGFAGFGSTELGGSQDRNGDGQADGDNLVWFITPGESQGVAGSHAGNRVLVARLSAMALAPGGDVNFSGEFTVQGFEDGNLFSEDVAFSTVPGPGALALLALGGLAGRRRRR
jgi:MYXO-CTERM domain-containing protein